MHFWGYAEKKSRQAPQNLFHYLTVLCLICQKHPKKRLSALISDQHRRAPLSAAVFMHAPELRFLPPPHFRSRCRKDNLPHRSIREPQTHQATTAPPRCEAYRSAAEYAADQKGIHSLFAASKLQVTSSNASKKHLPLHSGGTPLPAMQLLLTQTLYTTKGCRTDTLWQAALQKFLPRRKRTH